MAGEFSDGSEYSVVHEAELVDAAADTEMDLCLSPRDSKMQDRPREEILTHPGVLDQAAIDLDKQRQLTPPNGVKPKTSGHGLSLPLVMNACDHMLGAIAPVAGSDTGRRGQGAAGPAYPGLAQRWRRAGIDMPARFQFGKISDLQSPGDLFPPSGKQFEPNPLGAGFQRMFDSDQETRVPAGKVESELSRSPGAVLVDTVARLQLDMEELRADSLCHQTWGGPTSPRRSHQTTFTSTSLQGLLVGNNTNKFLTLLSCPVDGAMPWPPGNCSFTWMVTR